MLRLKLFTIYVAIKSLFCPCNIEETKKVGDFQKIKFEVEKKSKLAEQINECSGLVYFDSLNALLTHNDGGGKPELYSVDREGKLIATFKVEAANKDWEEICANQDNIFIGDFGNNLNVRKDLRIYIFNLQANETDIIDFRYEDQFEFPPSKNNLNFDCEAFVFFKDRLYLFSKNRGKGDVSIYSLPAKPGNYVAKKVACLPLNGMVTAATINSIGNEVVILTYGKMYLLSINETEGSVNFDLYACKRFGRAGQSEGIAYGSTDDELIVSNEGGKLFFIDLERKVISKETK